MASRNHEEQQQQQQQQEQPHIDSIGPDPAAPAHASPQDSSSTTSASSNKRIFAPGTTHSSSQADQYTKGALTLRDLHPTDPLSQFHAWFTHAQRSSVRQPETVCLSTCSLPSGRISSRYVYLKELDATGFVIYSNWGTSRKAADVESNPRAALAFWWHELERQVRVEGRVERLTREESQVYFDTRIRGSRIGAWASRQSSVLRPRGRLEEGGAGQGTGSSEDGSEGKEGGQEDDGRVELEQRVKEVERRFEGQEHIPVPEFWGGLRVVPDLVEFWQGRESRLHDRFRYTKADGEVDKWNLDRLSP